MRQYLLFTGLLFAQPLLAQNTFPASGNVGIGTTTPQVKLQIANGDVLLQNSTTGYPVLWSKDVSGSKYVRLDYNSVVSGGDPLILTSTGNQPLLLNTSSTGNVGIGTTTPQSHLSFGAMGDHLSIGRTDWGSKMILATGWTSGSGDFTDLKVPGSSANTALLRLQSNGYVGIGTTNPQDKVHIAGGGWQSLVVESTDGAGAALNLKSNNKMWHLSKRPDYEGDALKLFYHDGTTFTYPPAMSFATNGNVGIGVDVANAKLHVQGELLSTGDVRVGTQHDAAGYGPALRFGGYGNTDPVWLARYNNSNDYTELRLNLGDWPDGSDKLVIGATKWSDGQWTPGFQVDASGSVGIGTSDTKGYKLAVNGDAVFTRIKVKSFTAWPDYVFHPMYQLPSLKEVEAYIRQHRHLPDLPPAAEIEREGLDLGANQAALLKKIEELTLYAIEQQTLLQKLQARIETLERQAAISSTTKHP